MAVAGMSTPAYFRWAVWVGIRAVVAHFRHRPVALSGRDVDVIREILTLPGAGHLRFGLAGDIEALAAALVKFRMGVSAVESFATVEPVFLIVPSDLAGYPGPVRLVFVHDATDFMCSLPWPVPQEVAHAFARHLPGRDVIILPERFPERGEVVT